jgi:hypothetical protein
MQAESKQRGVLGKGKIPDASASARKNMKSNSYWSEAELERINTIATNAARNERAYSRMRWSAFVLFTLNLALVSFNLIKGNTGWSLMINLFAAWYMIRGYNRSTCSQQLWGEVRHHALRSMLETGDKADWHARRLHDCAHLIKGGDNR